MDRKYPSRNIGSKIHTEHHSLSHDLKNMLHNILTGIDLLKDQLHPNESHHALISSIENNAQLATQTLGQLDGANQSGHPNMTRVDLKSILLDTISLTGKNSEVSFSFDENVSSQIILGNQIDLKRILMNLINNSRESKAGNIVIKFSLDSIEVNKTKFARLIIEDDGPGIPIGYINKIFDKGFSSKGSEKNSGLGLAIVKEIMDSHNGQIKINSIEKRGTQIELCFPSLGELNKIDENEKMKVLIAEDNEFQRETLEHLLRSMKFDVYTASNGVEAFDIFTSIEPDIVFLDEKMPKMTGLECVKKIEEIKIPTKIVLLTGSNIDNKKSLGLAKILKKPYQFETIEATIQELF